MQPAQLANQLGSRAKIEVIGISKQDLTTQFFQISRQHGFYSSLSAHRHKGRRFDNTMRGNQAAESGAYRVSFDDLKV
jgi:hypothetical protein